MKISVVMSVYNGGDSIKAAIESILNQKFEDFEFIIVDDASTDNTFKIIQRYKKKDKRIKIIRNRTNIGLTKSLNKAIKLSKGEFIARQDVDDLSLIQRLEKQYNFLKNNLEYAFCGSNGLRKQNKKELVKYFEYDEIKKNLIIKNCFSHPSIVIRKSIFEKFGLYNEKFRYSQDYELWCRLLYKYNLKAKNLCDILIIRDIPLERFLMRQKRKYANQRFNSIKIILTYLRFSKRRIKCIIAIIIYFIEMFTQYSLIDFLLKI